MEVGSWSSFGKEFPPSSVRHMATARGGFKRYKPFACSLRPLAWQSWTLYVKCAPASVTCWHSCNFVDVDFVTVVVRKKKAAVQVRLACVVCQVS